LESSRFPHHRIENDFPGNSAKLLRKLVMIGESNNGTGGDGNGGGGDGEYDPHIKKKVETGKGRN
jgi:hypothetical protein